MTTKPPTLMDAEETRENVRALEENSGGTPRAVEIAAKIGAARAGTAVAAKPVLNATAQTEDEIVSIPVSKIPLAFRVYAEAIEKSEFPKAIGILGALLKKLEDEGDQQKFKLDLAKLSLLTDNPQNAYTILMELCAEKSLSEERAREALWFLFKSLRVQGINTETNGQFVEAMKLMEKLKIRYGASFDKSLNEIIDITRLAVRFRQIFEATAKGPDEEEKACSEGIEFGEHLRPYKESRVEADRLRLTGSCYFYKAETLKKKGVKQEDCFVIYEKAATCALQAIMQLKKLTHLEKEGGEHLMAHYNYAQCLLRMAKLRQGDTNMLRAAAEAIVDLRKLALQAKNGTAIARSEILEGELFRYGFSEKPNHEHLVRAKQANEKALAAKPRDMETLYHIYKNLAFLSVDIGDIVGAKTHMLAARDILEGQKNLRLDIQAERQELDELIRRLDAH